MSGTEVGRGEGGVVEAITARLDEIEETAKAAGSGGWDVGWGGALIQGYGGPMDGEHFGDVVDMPSADHIALNDPTAVLAMVAGLRTVVALHQPMNDWSNTAIGCVTCGSPFPTFDEPTPPSMWPCPTLTALADAVPDPSPVAPSEGAAGTEVGL